jgi:hypothetical protein
LPDLQRCLLEGGDAEETTLDVLDLKQRHGNLRLAVITITFYE